MAATNGPPLKPLRPVLSIIVQEVEAHGISTLGMPCRKSALIWGQFSQPVRVYEAFDPRPKCVGVGSGECGGYRQIITPLWFRGRRPWAHTTSLSGAREDRSTQLPHPVQALRVDRKLRYGEPQLHSVNYLPDLMILHCRTLSVSAGRCCSSGIAGLHVREDGVVGLPKDSAVEIHTDRIDSRRNVDINQSIFREESGESSCQNIPRRCGTLWPHNTPT